MTIKDAKDLARVYGCSLRKTANNEYRVCLLGLSEDHAAYESDLESAVLTAKAQHIWRSRLSAEECFRYHVPFRPNGEII